MKKSQSSGQERHSQWPWDSSGPLLPGGVWTQEPVGATGAAGLYVAPGLGPVGPDPMSKSSRVSVCACTCVLKWAVLFRQRVMGVCCKQAIF